MLSYCVVSPKLKLLPIPNGIVTPSAYHSCMYEDIEFELLHVPFVDVNDLPVPETVGAV